MSLADILVNLSGGIFLVFTLITAFFLLINGLKKQMSNIILLGVTFLAYSIQILVVTFTSSLWAQFAFIYLLINLCTYSFVYLTFYKGKSKKVPKIILGIYLFCYIAGSVFAIFYSYISDFNRTFYLIASLFDLIILWLGIGWYGISSLKAYRTLKLENIDPYIYKRLRLMGYSALISCVTYSFWQIEWFISTDLVYGIAYALSTIGGTFYAIGMNLTWIMPNWFKKFLNKGFTFEDSADLEKDLNENEILQQLGGENN